MRARRSPADYERSDAEQLPKRKRERAFTCASGVSIDRSQPGLTIVAMQLTGANQTGEPWQLRFVVHDTTGRMFLLGHSEYASEVAGTPTAIVCESERGGKHRNWGTTTAPTDVEGFDHAVHAAHRGAAASKLA